MCHNGIKRRPAEMLQEYSYLKGRDRATKTNTIIVSTICFPESITLYYYGLEFFFLGKTELPQISKSELMIAAQKETLLYILLNIDKNKKSYDISELTDFLTNKKLEHLPDDVKIRDISGEEYVNLLK